jgi:hypothetical protein
MLVVWLPFLDYMVENGFHVSANIWIIVFIDREGTRCVLNEKIQHTDLRKRLGEIIKNLLGYQVAASAFGR